MALGAQPDAADVPPPPQAIPPITTGAFRCCWRKRAFTRSAGLLPPNHYLSAAIYYLFQHRPMGSKAAAVGKTVVSSQMIDRVSAKLCRKLFEVPVGFKWFVDGLLDGSLAFGGRGRARCLDLWWWN